VAADSAALQTTGADILSRPRVTAFIPAFNREAYICTAINSLLAQEYTDFEVLVVDDGSTDNTAGLVERYDDPRVRLVRNVCNQGMPATRNLGLELARGEYIALLDSDDYAYPKRLGRQVLFLDRHPEIAQVGSWCSLMNADGDLLHRVRRHPTEPAEVDARLLFHCSLINRTIMGRTALLREYAYDETFSRCQDYELHARLAERHAMANMAEVLVCGREHEGRITRTTPALGREKKMAIQRRLLEVLDIRYGEQELAWHYSLTQKPTPDSPHALEYVAWAEAWLSQLEQANRRQKRYEPAFFAKTLGGVWAATCWLNRKGLGQRWPARMLRSRFVRNVAANVQVRWAGTMIWRRPLALNATAPAGPALKLNSTTAIETEIERAPIRNTERVENLP
jgi:glycosyltransferase involved in cell wall biosynthesis